MLHMGYSSASVIALVYEFTLYKKKFDSIQWHTGGDMTAFVSESTHLVTILVIVNHLETQLSHCISKYVLKLDI